MAPFTSTRMSRNSYQQTWYRSALSNPTLHQLSVWNRGVKARCFYEDQTSSWSEWCSSPFLQVHRATGLNNMKYSWVISLLPNNLSKSLLTPLGNDSFGQQWSSQGCHSSWVKQPQVLPLTWTIQEDCDTEARNIFYQREALSDTLHLSSAIKPEGISDGLEALPSANAMWKPTLLSALSGALETEIVNKSSSIPPFRVKKLH